MKFKSNKAFLLYFSISTAVIIIGYFLWTILIPIQDFNLMDKQELVKTQKELALNYDLGKFLLYVGFFGFISSIIGLLVNKRKIIKQ